MIIPLIMSGGSGTRLWPLSCQEQPKQFHTLVGTRSMFSQTLARVTTGVSGLAFDAPVIVLNERHVELAQSELAKDGITPKAMIVEPFGRNTAPAVAAAIQAIGGETSDDLMLMLPADHLIADVPAFHRAIEAGAEAAQNGSLVTFGIVPERPETGFGYIRRGAADGRSYRVEAFVEKPDAVTASQYLESGQYDWNAGIFLFRTDIMAGELKRQQPEIWGGVQAALHTVPAQDGTLLLEPEAFSKVAGDSIDYAVMENAARVNVVPVSMGWDDIGSWSQLHEASIKDAFGNTCIGDVIAIDAERSYLRSENGLLATVGVKDIVIIQTGNTTLVADKSRVQDVKRFVEELNAREAAKKRKITPEAAE